MAQPSPAASLPGAPVLLSADMQSVDRLSTIADEEDEKPVRCYKFRQQELWAVKPVWSPRCVVVLYYIIAVLFIPLGVAVFVMSLRMSHSDRFRYDDVPQCDVGEVGRDRAGVVNCTIRITVGTATKGRSYFYYGLVNYFQNARQYSTSRSAQQLRGQKSPSVGDCEGAGNGIDFSDDDKVVPCGLTAFSYFNDSFTLCRDESCEDEVKVLKKGIAWNIDVKQRFRAGDVDGDDGYSEKSNALVTDEDFMVWMRLSTYNNFHKLYRIIDEPLEAGNYFVRIGNRYPVEQFQGQKFVFISETRWFGGRSRFIGIAYLTVGSIAFVAATLFLIRSGSAPSVELPPETTIPLDGFADDINGGDSAGGPAPRFGGDGSQ